MLRWIIHYRNANSSSDSDFGFGLGVFATFVVFQSIEFETIFACAPLYAHTNFTIFNCEVDQLTCLAVLLFVGAVGKSSQIGLHT